MTRYSVGVWHEVAMGMRARAIPTCLFAAYPCAGSTLSWLSPPPTPPCRSGVPPDAFSETGQLWGSPLYEWKAHKAEDFAWWRQRISRSMQVGGWVGLGVQLLRSAAEIML
jgi:4-alpha-glucanotransferase